jgi:hypothetical protein
MKKYDPKVIMQYISDFWKNNYYPPTIRDVQKGCEMSSTSVACYVMKESVQTGELMIRNGHPIPAWIVSSIERGILE